MNKITIDVTKIVKAKLREGKYLDLVQIDYKEGARDKTKKDGSLIETATSKLVETGIVKQDAPKGEEMPILGNTSHWVDKDSTTGNFKAQEAMPEVDWSADVPF
jgi:hypothetical protein